jgi:hypothetical protein
MRATAKRFGRSAPERPEARHTPIPLKVRGPPGPATRSLVGELVLRPGVERVVDGKLELKLALIVEVE